MVFQKKKLNGFSFSNHTYNSYFLYFCKNTVTKYEASLLWFLFTVGNNADFHYFGNKFFSGVKSVDK